MKNRYALLSRPHAMIAVLVISLFASSVASAGLFGGFARAVGIGGAIGDGLNFVDGLLPGGGGVTDGILGAPANAMLGGAIKNWKESNDQSIEKLGRTNDATVAKLIAGLDSNIDNLSYNINKSIDSLDISLQGAIEGMDNSLSNQTGRLDTVFQKQTSTFVYLCRILLTIFVVSISFYGIIKLITGQREQRSYLEMIKANKLRASAVLLTGLFVILVTWLTPDPSGAAAREKQFTDGYVQAMNLEDYVGANYNSAQLSILRPADPLIRAEELKSKAFRELFYRPTVLLDSSKANSLMSVLSQADSFHMKATGANDPEIATIFGLIALQSMKSNADLIEAVVLLKGAQNLYTAAQPEAEKGDPTSSNEADATSGVPAITKFAAINDVLASSIKDIAIDPAAVRAALQGVLPAQVERLLQDYAPNVLKSDNQSAKSINYGPFSSVSEMVKTTENRMKIVTLYRNMLSYYFDHGKLNKNGGTPADIHDNMCNAFKAYKSWHEANYATGFQSDTFVAAVFSGPFRILARLQAASPGACPGVSDAEMAAYSDFVTLWIAGLERGASGTAIPPGVAALKSVALALAAKQDALLTSYDDTASKMQSYESRRQAPATAQEANNDLLQWLSASTLMGMSTRDGNRMVPVAAWALSEYDKNQLPDDMRQKLSLQYIYAPLY